MILYKYIYIYTSIYIYLYYMSVMIVLIPRIEAYSNKRKHMVSGCTRRSLPTDDLSVENGLLVTRGQA